MQGDTVYLYGCECGDRIRQVRGDLLASLHAKQRQVVGHNNHENIVLIICAPFFQCHLKSSCWLQTS